MAAREEYDRFSHIDGNYQLYIIYGIVAALQHDYHWKRDHKRPDSSTVTFNTGKFTLLDVVEVFQWLEEIRVFGAIPVSQPVKKTTWCTELILHIVFMSRGQWFDFSSKATLDISGCHKSLFINFKETDMPKVIVIDPIYCFQEILSKDQQMSVLTSIPKQEMTTEVANDLDPENVTQELLDSEAASENEYLHVHTKLFSMTFLQLLDYLKHTKCEYKMIKEYHMNHLMYDQYVLCIELPHSIVYFYLVDDDCSCGGHHVTYEVNEFQDYETLCSAPSKVIYYQYCKINDLKMYWQNYDWLLRAVCLDNLFCWDG